MRKNCLYVVPDGGIGNRLRALVSGIWLADKIGLSPVVVWHSDSLCQADLSDIVRTELIPAEIITPGELSYRMVYEVPRLRNLKLPALFAPMKFVKRFYDYKNLLRFLDDSPSLLRELSGAAGDVLFFSGQEFFDFPREYFREIIVPSERVSVRADEILAGGIPDFSIQIRRTDNVQSITKSPEEKFEDIVRNHAPATFFLATDSKEVKEQFLRKFPQRILYNNRDADRASREGIVDAMAEIVVMSRTRKIFASYASSFPHIASWLSGTRIEIVKADC